MIAYTKGELMDRYTIERRKRIYGAENEELLAKLVKEIAETHWTTEELLSAIDLAMANDSIAVLEWQIRADHKLSDEEVGLRARAIRRINGRRVAAKSTIDQTKSLFVPAFEFDLDKVNLAVPDSAK